jgi:hypothetical protein
MAEPPDPFPHPPFPHPDSKLLDVIVTNSLDAFRAGEVDAEGAIMHAAVHGWYEGHVEGEDFCPGCTVRGDQELRRKLSNP